MTTQDEKAQRNRERFPLTAQALEQAREIFGPGVQVTWLSEGGVEVGKPSDQLPGTWVSLKDIVIARKPNAK